MISFGFETFIAFQFQCFDSFADWSAADPWGQSRRPAWNLFLELVTFVLSCPLSFLWERRKLSSSWISKSPMRHPKSTKKDTRKGKQKDTSPPSRDFWLKMAPEKLCKKFFIRCEKTWQLVCPQRGKLRQRVKPKFYPKVQYKASLIPHTYFMMYLPDFRTK